MDFSYSMPSDPNGSVVNVQFNVYDDTGSSVGTFSEDSSTSVTGVSDASTLYVVMTIDTTGVSSNDDLSGNVSISVS
jgi:hypothetical protein